MPRTRKNPKHKGPVKQDRRKDNLEVKAFRFNSFQQISLRGSWFATYANRQCYLAAWSDVNGSGYGLYDDTGAAINPTLYQTNPGTVWGSAQTTGAPTPGATDQFPQWAQLYSLYRVNNIGVRLTPFSMVTTGSQGPMTSFTDPQGLLAGLISRGVSLPTASFQGAMGDTKDLKMTMPFKQVRESLSLKGLIAMEQAESFIQTIDGGLDSGFRSLYNSFSRYGRAITDPAVTGAKLPAKVVLMPFIFTDATINTVKPLAVFQPYADIVFTQRRTSLPSLSLGELAFQADQAARCMERYHQGEEMRKALGLLELGEPEKDEEETPLTKSTMSSLKELITKL